MRRVIQVLSVAMAITLLPTIAQAQEQPSLWAWDVLSVGVTRDDAGQDRTVVGSGAHVSIVGGLFDTPTLIDFGPGVMAGMVMGNAKDQPGNETPFWGVYLPVTLAFSRDVPTFGLHFSVGYVLGGARARDSGARKFFNAGITIPF